MKTCFKCHSPKPYGDFYKHPQMGDGYLGKCKECTKADTIANRAAKVDYYRHYDRVRNSEEHRVRGRKEYSKTEAYRVSTAKGSRRWAKKNPRKKAAQVLFNNRKKVDPSLGTKPCVRCGNPKAQAHHENYDYPLDVVWLCAKHHAERHKEMRKEGIKP